MTKKYLFKTDIEECKKDLLYLVEPVNNWKEKPFLFTAIICHLTTYPFNYSKTTAINAYDQLTNTKGLIGYDV